MKLYSNEGYGLAHTIYDNISSMMMSALAALVLGYMAILIITTMVLMSHGYDDAANQMAWDGMLGLMALVIPIWLIAIIRSWADDKASRAFRVHLDAYRTSK